jgi:hypothetical protein
MSQSDEDAAMSRHRMRVVTLLLLGGSILGCSSSSNSGSSSAAQEPEVPVVSKPIPPDSPFAKVKVGMASDEVFATIGRPTSEDTYQTGKAFIPFHYGGDNVRMAAHYKGQGIITFSQDSAFTSSFSVMSVDYDADEPGYVKKSP